jgi:hypothetical protein
MVLGDQVHRDSQRSTRIDDELGSTLDRDSVDVVCTRNPPELHTRGYQYRLDRRFGCTHRVSDHGRVRELIPEHRRVESPEVKYPSTGEREEHGEDRSSDDSLVRQ